MKLARDAYSYLHLFLVAGIVFLAVGAHTAVEHVAVPLESLPAISLTGGVALFYSPMSPIAGATTCSP